MSVDVDWDPEQFDPETDDTLWMCSAGIDVRHPEEYDGPAIPWLSPAPGGAR